ncbi:GNAT family N-acetyltransferase [Allonocardiopsis opalescens]|uniref:Acetyltransferase (GNAT) family protein n=1 Tax=Allonocardiopsis opalescens TaxID=1144618 RepID=A0A2T0QE19_9ACTN|nr:GNAT family N-acetyltransferase [Allonocardiopsis opalescens]PRY02169.1 hypothetical protein CLV72_101770 [Allonocardiopsis opalescens]
MTHAELTPMRTAAPPQAAVEYTHLDGEEVAGDPTPWAALYAEVYAGAAHLADHRDPPFAARLAHSAARPGFRLTAGHVGGEPAGFVYGYTLGPDTGWWRGLDPEPDPGFVQEWPGRTVAVCEGLILPRFRGLGLTGTAMAAFLTGRTEERAAGLVAESNEHALSVFLRHGWMAVGTTVPYPGWRRHTAIVLPLRAR